MRQLWPCQFHSPTLQATPPLDLCSHLWDDEMGTVVKLEQHLDHVYNAHEPAGRKECRCSFIRKAATGPAPFLECYTTQTTHSLPAYIRNPTLPL